jgi:transposase
LKVLKKENETLRRSLLPKKNSHNSSIPPSQDENRPKRNQSLRQKSNKKLGGQPGHPDSSMKMSLTPNHVEKLLPGYCNKCGSDLSGSEAELLSKRQFIDLPEITPTITEYQNFGRQCSCGHLQSGGFPPHITNHIQYGANVEASVAYYSIYQYIPVKRMCEMFHQLFNLPISQGTIINMLRRMGKKAQPVYTAIHSNILKSTVVGGDETGAKVDGDKYWAWIWQNAFMTYITVSVSRGKKTIELLFPEGFINAILCSDRWRAQIATYAKGHQLCMAHLLRDLNYLIELEKTSWAENLKSLFQKAISLKKHCPEHDSNNPDAMALESELDKLLAEHLDQEKTPKTLVFQNSMKDYRDYLFTFLYHKDVPPDNNGSERAARNFKIKMKISGQFKTGHQTYAILRSVVDTCIKQNVSVKWALSQIALIQLVAE